MTLRITILGMGFILSAIIVVFIFIYVSLIMSFDKRQEQQARIQLSGEASVLQSAIVDNLLEGNIDSIRRAIEIQGLMPYIADALVLDENEKIIASSRPDLLDANLSEYLEDLPVDITNRVRESFSGEIVKNRTGQHIVVVYPVITSREMINFKPVDVGLLVLVYDLEKSIRELNTGVLKITAQSAVGIFVLLLIVGVMLHGIITRRINKILAAANGYIGGDNKVRIVLDGRDEITEIANAFDQVMDSADRALTDLRRSRESLNRAQRIAHIGNWDWDIVKGTLAWSDEIYRIFGLQPQEFGATYEAFLQYIHPDDRDAVTAAVGASLEKNVPYSIEHRVVHKDGTVRVVHEHGKIERDDAGAPIFMSGTVQDITERKAIDLALQDAREKLEQKVEERTRELSIEKARAEDYLNIAGTIIAALDRDGTLMLINRKGCEVLGYDKKDLIGKNWFDLAIPAEHRVEVRSVFAKILSGDLAPVENFENHIVTRSGERRLVSWHNTYLHDEQGRITGALSAGEDITERREAEEALINSRKELLKAQAITGMGNWNWRVDDLSEVWSDQLYRIFGLEPGSVVPSHQLFMEAVHPDDRASVIEAIDAAVRENRPYSIDYRIIRPDGEVRYVTAQGETSLGDDGAAEMMVGTVLDITERKSIEQKLVQSAKMATLGEMATGVAHELNQPLNVIRMAVSNIQRKSRKDEADPAYLNDKLAKIESQVERAAAIIDHMRIFGRRADVKPVPLDPRKMVESTMGLIGAQLRLGGVEVTLDLPETCPDIMGHQVQVEQVLLNLLGNARDQLQKAGGEKRIRIAVAGNNQSVRIEVDDTGGGIPDDVLPRVFEPFFTTKEVGFGTGLGLSISYGIINDMGGRIEASNTAQGARFTITLPAHGNPVAA